MAVFSIEALINSWVNDELEHASKISGEDFGRYVTMMLLQTPQGDAIIWVILATLRSPYLGRPPIGSRSTIQANIPDEQAVRKAVRTSIESLRREFERQKAEGFKPAVPGPVNFAPPGPRRMN